MITDLMGAALPWISMGLLLAVFFAGEASRKKTESEEERNHE